MAGRRGRRPIQLLREKRSGVASDEYKKVCAVCGVWISFINRSHLRKVLNKQVLKTKRKQNKDKKTNNVWWGVSCKNVTLFVVVSRNSIAFGF